jgi:hypothetical protein
MVLTMTETSKLIPRNWSVPETFHRRLGREAGRQRAMVADGHLLLILHDLPEPGVPERRALLFWRSPDGAWKTTDAGAGLPALEALLTRYAARIDDLEEALSRAKEAKHFFEILRSATPAQRSLRNMQDALQSARDAIDDREIIALRDRSYDIHRAADLLVTDTRTAMEHDLAQVAEEQAKLAQELARSGHRLNLLAALFLPLTAIASVFGMNLPSGLEQYATPWAFWGTLVAGTLIGFVVLATLGRSTDRR